MDDITPEAVQALLRQTMEIGQLLHSVADKDPEGTPTAIACTAFKHWAEVAGPHSTEPRYFVDVLENYDAEGRSNKDLFDVFELLDPYLELPYEDEEEPEVDSVVSDKPRTFISLPIS